MVLIILSSFILLVKVTFFTRLFQKLALVASQSLSANQLDLLMHVAKFVIVFQWLSYCNANLMIVLIRKVLAIITP